MSTFLYRNPRLLALALLLITVAGLSAFQLMPRREDPEFQPRYAMIVTQYPGASAERVEALVTRKIEDKIRELDFIKKVESISRTGVSVIPVEYLDGVEDLIDATARVRDRVEHARNLLPPGALRPEVRDSTGAHSLVVGVTALAGHDVPPSILGRLAKDLEDRLRNLPGTKETERYGEPQEEVTVIVDPGRLAALGLATEDIAGAIHQADAKVRAGQVRGSKRNLLVEVEGEIDSLDRLRRLAITTRPDASALVLGDIATITKSEREPRREYALIDGEPGVAVAVRLASGARIDRWAGTARAALADFETELPRGVACRVLFDQSRYTAERLGSLARNLLLGALAVGVVVLLLMGWRSAIVVATALPLTGLFVLAGLHLLGIPLHQISITGLILALGLLIDDAIVIVDEMQWRLGRGETTLAAIRGSVRQLAMPMIGTTVTTALAFLPLALMPGGAGDFVGSIAYSVILAIGGALLLSLTVIPALLGLMSKAFRAGADSWWDRGIVIAPLAAAYRASLDTVVRRPWAGIVAAALLPVLGFAMAGQLEERFFPAADRDQLQVHVELPSHSSIEETRRAALVVRERLLARARVEAVHWFVGTSAPMFYYNMFIGQDDAHWFAEGIVQLDSHEGAQRLVREIQEDLDDALPNARVIVRPFEQGPPFDAPIELHLTGPDLERLADLGDDARSVLARVPGVIHTRTTLRAAKPKLYVDLDDTAARLVGFDNVRVAGRLEATLEGSIGGTMLEGTEELPVRVRAATGRRDDVADVVSTELGLPGRGSVPLAAVGKTSLVPELRSIPRRDGQRVNTVQGFVRAGTLAAPVNAAFHRELAAAGFRLPSGYGESVGGESAERSQAIADLLAFVALLGIMMAATLVLSFGSFRLTFLIAMVAVLSVGLALAALWLFGHVFGFMAIVGTVGLIGVAINDAIVVLAAIRADPAARAGDRAALCDVVFRSTRHVVATTLTTIAGFLPLLIAGGGLWPPLAIAIAGGVVGATLLALYFAPAAYLLLGVRSAPPQDGPQDVGAAA